MLLSRKGLSPAKQEDTVALFDKIKKTLEHDRPLTEEQRAFLDAVKSSQPGQAFGLEAKAGTGKTYTIIRAAEELQGSVLMLAFNAKIRKELQARAPRGCAVHTFHSYCNNVLFRSRKYEIKPGMAKIYNYMKNESGGVKQFRARWPIAQGVSLAKNLAFGLIMDDNEENWRQIYHEYDIRIPRGVSEDYVIEHARRMFRETTRSKTMIDYDDMLYYVARDGVGGDRWDYVLVDEAQDTNLAQFRVLDHLFTGDTRLLFVGDPQQAIYGWRGAGVDAFDVMADRYEAKVFDLTTTWRCPRAVVEEAQRVVPKIKYAPDASDGEVATLHPSVFDVTAVEPGNAVLCRNNAPLLQAALSCLQAGVGCVMLGRDVAKAITHQTDAAIKLSGSIRDTAMFSRLRAKYDAELADRPFALAQATEEVEMAATMFAYIQGREVPYTSEEELLSCIESICNRLLSDELRTDRIVFSTIHRSKGLEWPSVYLIQPEKIPAKAARKVGGWHLEQERNLAYVAITRAKERLVYVSASEDPLKWILELSAADHEDRQEED